MSIATETTLRIVLYEGQGSEALGPDERLAMTEALLEKGYALTRATGSGSVAGPSLGSVLVLGRFEAGNPPDIHLEGVPGDVTFHDVTGLDPQGVVALAEESRAQSQSAVHGQWKPWFPVIDFDRCTNCMQCLSFCLFDVYGVDEEQRIQVQNNDNCKTNCPACSRVCPEAAIMFPKYRSGPINGDQVSDSDLNQEKMKVDISSLLGGDIYSMLRQRSETAKSRFSKERDSGKALNERQKCLTKLAAAGDIPPEVLASLPSQEEILQKAEEAKAKASAALAAQPGGTKGETDPSGNASSN